MNWKQIYTASTPEEQLENLNDMLKMIEARKTRKVLVHGRLIRDRRGGQSAHFLNDRRRGKYIPFFGLYKLALWVLLLAMTASTWVLLWSRPAQGVYFLSAYLGTILMIFLIKPMRARMKNMPVNYQP